MSDVALTGHCNCGAVRIEISEPLLGAAYCHCTRCQRRTGAAASASAAPKPGTFRIVAGEDKVRRWNAGDGFDKAFCEVCGSALFAQNPENADQVAVRLGILDSDPIVRPGGRQFVDNAAVWEPLPEDGLTRFPGSFSDGPAPDPNA